MDFFEWKDDEGGNTLPRAFWIYVGAVVSLTFITCSIFYVCVLRQRKKVVSDVEALLG